MSWGRLPLFVWTILIYSILLILALPVDRRGGDDAAHRPPLRHRTSSTRPSGGSPLLWQHLFWFFGHPEVYIMVLPGFGIISEILPVFARKPIFGYKAIAASTVAIAFLGLLVWAHHMFATPIADGRARLLHAQLVLDRGADRASRSSTGSRRCGAGTIEFKTPLLFARGFIALFVIGGISGVILAIFPVDWQLTDTYFVVAHFHYVLFGGAVFAIFAGLYYWFPKMTGRMLSEGLGQALVLADVRRLQRDLPDPALDRARRACRGASTSTPDVGNLQHLQPDLDDRLVHPRASACW